MFQALVYAILVAWDSVLMTAHATMTIYLGYSVARVLRF